MRARRWITALLLAGAALVGAGAFAVGWTGSNQAVRPPWYQHRTPAQGLVPMDPGAAYFIWQGGYRDPGSDLGLDFDSVEFPTAGGSTLRGWLVPGVAGARAGVVAVHGGGADRREFLRQVPVFHRAGYPVLLFDCREQGISDGTARGISLGFRESEDAAAAAHWARERLGLQRVALIGTSQGAASAILAAAADPAIDVVIAENPFTSVPDLIRDVRLPDGDPIPGWASRLVAAFAVWRMGGTGRPAPIDVVGSLAPRPLLLMHGSKDFVIPTAHSERLRAAARGPVELWIVEGGEHSALYNRAPEEWDRRVSGFLAQWLGPALGPSGSP